MTNATRPANPFAQFGKRERPAMGREAHDPEKELRLEYNAYMRDLENDAGLWLFEAREHAQTWLQRESCIAWDTLGDIIGGVVKLNHPHTQTGFLDFMRDIRREWESRKEMAATLNAAPAKLIPDEKPAPKQRTDPFGKPYDPVKVAMRNHVNAARGNENDYDWRADANDYDAERNKYMEINTQPLVVAAITQGKDDPTPTPSPDIETGEIAIPAKELSELDKVFGPKAKAPGEVTTLTDDEMKETLRMKYREGLGRDMTVADFERATEWKRLEDARYADKGALTDAEIMKMAEADIAAQKKIAQEAPKAVEIEVAATTLPEATDKPATQGQISVEKSKPAKTLALVPTGDSKWDVMTQQAQVMLKSGFMPSSIKSAEQVLTIAMMGEALGIAPIVAINNINVIQGKPTVSPQLMLALVRRSGQLEDMKVEDDGTTCTVTMKRKGETAHVEKFSQSDAVTMGLASKDNWRKQPAVMRKWRAVSAACRIVFPDLIWGLYTTEELAPDTIVVETAA